MAKVHSLRTLYDRARALNTPDFEVTPQALRENLKVTERGASCLFYMLQASEYCPELEALYTQTDAPLLEGRNENSERLIKFSEDMPPFLRLCVYIDKLSESDKATYVRIGVANWMSY